MLGSRGGGVEHMKRLARGGRQLSLSSEFLARNKKSRQLAPAVPPMWLAPIARAAPRAHGMEGVSTTAVLARKVLATTPFGPLTTLETRRNKKTMLEEMGEKTYADAENRTKEMPSKRLETG